MDKSPERSIHMVKRYAYFNNASPQLRTLLLDRQSFFANQMDLRDKCCFCPNQTNRCGTNECACWVAGKACNERCETVKLKANCINQAVTRCYCVKGASASRGSKADPGCCNTVKCLCVALHEKCSLDCACYKDCPNRSNANTAGKLERPQKGCKCSSGKKSCYKQKCPCKQVLEHCSPEWCKCQGNCANGPDFQLSRGARSCFANPDQDVAAMVVRLSGDGNYAYQMEFCSGEKGAHAEEAFYETILNMVTRFSSPLTSIAVYLSKSPCYHQDCEPRCEVLESCEAHKACAWLLRAALRQSQRHLSNCNITMSVKFLSPYVKRGDLYTKQAILCLMEAGMTVEPLTLREWSNLMQEATADGMAPTPAATNSAHLTLWATNNMDRHIRHAQHYINSCRRTLGLMESLWTSNFHELLKTTILTCGQTRFWLEKLGKQLAQPDQPWFQEDATSSALERSVNAKISSGGSPRIVTSKSSTTKEVKPGLIKSLSKHALSADIPPEATIDTESDPTLADLAGTQQAATLERMLLNFTSRSLGEHERNEIKTEIAVAVDRLQKDITNLLQFLDYKSGTHHSGLSSNTGNAYKDD